MLLALRPFHYQYLGLITHTQYLGLTTHSYNSIVGLHAPGSQAISESYMGLVTLAQYMGLATLAQ